MRTNSARLAVGLAGFLAVSSFAAERGQDVVQVERGGECTAVLGQTVHFILRYDGFAGQVITNLEATIDDKLVPKPEVKSRADPKLVDVGQVIFVFHPEQTGTYRVKVTPLVGDAKRKPVEFVLKVEKK